MRQYHEQRFVVNEYLTAPLGNSRNIMPTTHEMYDQAVELKNQGDLEGAVSKLKEVLEVDPQHGDSHSALAVYLQRIGRFDEAIEHAKKVCEIAPNDSFSYTQLSVIYVKCGKIQEAEDAKAKEAEVRAMNS
jgi:Flp pilus assembly protein TadD